MARFTCFFFSDLTSFYIPTLRLTMLCTVSREAVFHHFEDVQKLTCESTWELEGIGSNDRVCLFQ